MPTNLITKDNTIFALMSFEGPDKYSMVGGLGIRMTEMSRVLAEHGYKSHLFFVGDPYAECNTEMLDGHLRLHRWCQWISSECPGGVYDGEEKKIAEWNRSVPDYIVNNIVAPAAQKGFLTVILGEDWHTAESIVLLDKLLREKHLRDHCVIFWNVNNEYGLNGIDIKEVEARCTITTVSKFMVRRLKELHGVDSIAIPNGIPRRIIGSPDPGKSHLIKRCFDGIILQKVARYDLDKGWLAAVEATAILKKRGLRPHLLMRGGTQHHRTEVICKILDLDLRYVTIRLRFPTFENIIEAFQSYSHFDIIEMDFFIPEDFLMLLYGSADVVLANSIYEPFGIVGLEVMAKGGIGVVGNTGEDYALHNKNAIKVKSDSAIELAETIYEVMSDGDLKQKIRKSGFKTANVFTWDRALSLLIYRVEKVLSECNLPRAGVKKHSDGEMLLEKKHY